MGGILLTVGEAPFADLALKGQDLRPPDAACENEPCNHASTMLALCFLLSCLVSVFVFVMYFTFFGVPMIHVRNFGVYNEYSHIYIFVGVRYKHVRI